ncbi:hypothetical protein CEUSTIGMA_g6394.t1 [Chlamydomonas eustigma]|uniref:Protein kinase domain-containing protein n=1 Tax=Chlamydomonas eustigma TaxID=1157962 RepID=A0A250X793_9CHLO|nr:hypothetical protein CEUSTIGMA_g6394.t1 [Chlamydomonas eustigma]|eukprot:GAX78954.1 hypothetical protein CEUSTIGMA_g6394.t1 [Chlamydomonas eustigma]
MPQFHIKRDVCVDGPFVWSLASSETDVNLVRAPQKQGYSNAAKTVQARLFREASLTSTLLWHENLLSLRNITLLNKQIMLMYEPCQEVLTHFKAKRLTQPTNNSSPVSDSVKNLVNQLVSAVEHLHANEVAHLSIHPQSIFLQNKDSNNGNVLKLAGLDAAQILSTARHNKQTGNKQPSRYSAPEVVLGDICSYPADIWSIGCITAELLTGRQLFTGQQDWEILSSIYKVVGFSNRHLAIAQARKDGNNIFQAAATCDTDGLKKRLYNSLDSSAVHFLKACLHEDPNKRATAQKLLSNDFLKGCPSNDLQAKLQRERDRFKEVFNNGRLFKHLSSCLLEAEQELTSQGVNNLEGVVTETGITLTWRQQQQMKMTILMKASTENRASSIQQCSPDNNMQQYTSCPSTTGAIGSIDLRPGGGSTDPRPLLSTPADRARSRTSTNTLLNQESNSDHLSSHFSCDDVGSSVNGAMKCEQQGLLGDPSKVVRRTSVIGTASPVHTRVSHCGDVPTLVNRNTPPISLSYRLSVAGESPTRSYPSSQHTIPTTAPSSKPERRFSQLSSSPINSYNSKFSSIPIMPEAGSRSSSILAASSTVGPSGHYQEDGSPLHPDSRMSSKASLSETSHHDSIRRPQSQQEYNHNVPAALADMLDFRSSLSADCEVHEPTPPASTLLSPQHHLTTSSRLRHQDLLQRCSHVPDLGSSMIPEHRGSLSGISTFVNMPEHRSSLSRIKTLLDLPERRGSMPGCSFPMKMPEHRGSSSGLNTCVNLGDEKRGSLINGSAGSPLTPTGHRQSLSGATASSVMTLSRVDLQLQSPEGLLGSEGTTAQPAVVLEPAQPLHLSKNTSRLQGVHFGGYEGGPRATNTRKGSEEEGTMVSSLLPCITQGKVTATQGKVTASQGRGAIINGVANHAQGTRVHYADVMPPSSGIHQAGATTTRLSLDSRKAVDEPNLSSGLKPSAFLMGRYERHSYIDDPSRRTEAGGSNTLISTPLPVTVLQPHAPLISPAPLSSPRGSTKNLLSMSPSSRLRRSSAVSLQPASSTESESSLLQIGSEGGDGSGYLITTYSSDQYSQHMLPRQQPQQLIYSAPAARENTIMTIKIEQSEAPSPRSSTSSRLGKDSSMRAAGFHLSTAAESSSSLGGVEKQPLHAAVPPSAAPHYAVAVSRDDDSKTMKLLQQPALRKLQFNLRLPSSQSTDAAESRLSNSTG